jgi:hypothetical protein
MGCLYKKNFKKRQNNNYKKINFKIFFYKIILFKQCYFKYIYFFFFKKYLKNNFKLKYNSSFKIKLWVFFNSNFAISKKSKNSRMGKGSGNFLKWEVKLKKNFIIIRFLKINYFRLKKLIEFWLSYFNSFIILV